MTTKMSQGSIEEWIDVRAAELLEKYAADENTISNELDYFFTEEVSHELEDELLRFFMAMDQAKSNEAMALAGTELFKLLNGHVTEQLKIQARLNAEIESVLHKKETEKMHSESNWQEIT